MKSQAGFCCHLRFCAGLSVGDLREEQEEVDETLVVDLRKEEVEDTLVGDLREEEEEVDNILVVDLREEEEEEVDDTLVVAF